MTDRSAHEGAARGPITRIVVPALAAIGAMALLTGAAFALSLSPTDAPHDEDLPIVTAPASRLTTATATAGELSPVDVSGASDTTPPAESVRSTSTSKPPAAVISGRPGTPAGDTGAAGKGKDKEKVGDKGKDKGGDDDDDREVVTPPVHESDGDEHDEDGDAPEGP